MTKIVNNANKSYLELDALENTYVNVACRLGLADFFCLSQVILINLESF